MSRRTEVVRRSGRRFSLDGAEELPNAQRQRRRPQNDMMCRPMPTSHL
jgi:hypothetical protein